VFQIGTASGHELPKSERGPVSKLPLRCASCSIDFRRVETDKPKGLACNADRVTVNNLNLARSERGRIRNRGDKGENENESEMANHRARIAAAPRLLPGTVRFFIRGVCSCAVPYNLELLYRRGVLSWVIY
jgi:hypothetical protein